MSQVRIVNWLLTRKCNLKCDYCGIVKNYRGMPKQYPDMNHYIKNEMPTQVIINALKAFKIHNPEAFHILYGGEPTLRIDLPDIINYCNENEIHYTIISNNTKQVQPMIKRLLDKVDYIQGFTSSVDPVFNQTYSASKKRDKSQLKYDDSFIKSVVGFKRLKEMQGSGKIKDVVAEITVMRHNQHFLYQLVKELSQENIYSDITFIDISKNRYYDFSNIYEETDLVRPTLALADELNKIMNDDSLLVHMKEFLLPKMFDTLPSNFDCEIDRGLHNISIDADGTIRLCLRIKGTTASKFNVTNLFDPTYPTLIAADVFSAIKTDKKYYCKLCNHSCLMMSQYFDNTNEKVDDLIHSDKRG